MRLISDQWTLSVSLGQKIHDFSKSPTTLCCLCWHFIFTERFDKNKVIFNSLFLEQYMCFIIYTYQSQGAICSTVDESLVHYHWGCELEPLHHFFSILVHCGHLLGKARPLVCDVLLCFCYFPMWYPGSGVVLDCIDSWSLPPFLLYIPYCGLAFHGISHMRFHVC